MLHRSTPLAVFFALAVLTGCSDRPQTYLVHGMVVYPDGKPLTKGTVEFEALDLKRPITASGEIAADGTFQLGTFEANDGAIAGSHRVAVIADPEIGTGAERPELLPPLVLDPRFSEFKTAGLEFTIKPGINNLLVEVDYAPPRQSASGAVESPVQPGSN
ncbi:MAG: hypothetical protein O3B13_15505 [Planctomycetota bacterium]|nr:hypothetical protein [Planctomycetota bacterium]MDA1164499.1 hypothetical protein [Planctomycetota bacterium]